MAERYFIAGLYFLSLPLALVSDITPISAYSMLKDEKSETLPLPNGGFGDQEKIMQHFVKKIVTPGGPPKKVWGHSQGGYFAIRLALEYPEAIEQGISIATPFGDRVEHWAADWPVVGDEAHSTMRHHIERIRDAFDATSSVAFVASEKDELVPFEDGLFLDLEDSENVKRVAVVHRGPGAADRWKDIRTANWTQLEADGRLGHIEIPKNEALIRYLKSLGNTAVEAVSAEQMPVAEVETLPTEELSAAA
jgi:fermentation-respiration switch protein FrsA (DUF1100 family)